MITTILFDFDGVILDSMSVRDKGFERIFDHFPKEQTEQLMLFHKANGGLSRYVKIRHFFEVIRNEEISQDDVMAYATLFSEMMRKELTDPSRLIQDCVNFIKQHHKTYHLHIVSGSDQNELRFLCRELGIDSYFITIAGSPVAKTVLVKDVMQSFSYNPLQTVLIGDSVNDYEAAESNGILFMGYNNESLKQYGKSYIYSFADGIEGNTSSGI